MSKAWPLLDLPKFPMSQQLTPFVKEKFNIIDNKKQQRIIPEPTQISSVSLIHQETITSHPDNVFDLASTIYQLSITPGPVQIDLTLFNISISSMNRLFTKKHSSKIFFLQANSKNFVHRYTTKISQT